MGLGFSIHKHKKAENAETLSIYIKVLNNLKYFEEW